MANDKSVIESITILTNGVATPVVRFTMPTPSACGGTLDAVIIAENAANLQSHKTTVSFCASNKTGTPVSANVDNLEANAFTAGTLTDTWTDTNAPGTYTLNLNANSSLPAKTRLVVLYSLSWYGDSNVTVAFL